MTPLLIASLSALAAGSGFAAAVLLYLAGSQIPHDRISWDGQTPFEAQFRRRKRSYAFFGILAALVSVLCSLTVAAGSYTAISN
jgi:hypothetical protein